MNAIRQIQQVRNHTVLVHLPEDFPAKSVEVIIFPTTELPIKSKKTKTDKVLAAVHHFFTMDTSQFTAAQRQTYDQACTIIRRGRDSGEPRILGLFAGLMQIADDFDAPLTDEDVFWGKSTNEYGISLEK
ncbi:MAG: hypothetical protein ABIG63_20325 [Chloroflexota bacterium]